MIQQLRECACGGIGVFALGVLVVKGLGRAIHASAAKAEGNDFRVRYGAGT